MTLCQLIILSANPAIIAVITVQQQEQALALLAINLPLIIEQLSSHPRYVFANLAGMTIILIYSALFAT